jgi:hypothetical protein
MKHLSFARKIESRIQNIQIGIKAIKVILASFVFVAYAKIAVTIVIVHPFIMNELEL